MDELEYRIALRNCGIIDPESLDDYEKRGQGYSGLRKALSMDREGVIGELQRSGLRGRGGAGYPTAQKWRAVAAVDSPDKFVVCNGVDGDPRSRASQLFLDGDPHTVLEGALIAAYAVGASRCVVAVAEGSEQVLSRLEKATLQMGAKGLLGPSILGSAFACEIEIREVPLTFVAGEETALLRALAGKQAMPYVRPPYPIEEGYDGRPTLMQNIETLSNVSAILQRGSAWFSAVGTAESKGSKIVTLTGTVKIPCTAEVSFGTLLSQMIEVIGGTPRTDIKAVQVGGPTGVYIGAHELDIPFSYEAIEAAGGIIGSGSIEVIPIRSCAVELTEALMTYVHGQSCGKCVFCREGTQQMADILGDIFKGEGKMQDLDLLEELGTEMKTAAICGFGKSAPNPVLSSIRLFREDYESHIKGRKCPT